MTSPITHEKIIEVLREADEAFTSGDLSGHDVIMTEEYRRGIVIVRDLYQRLQAEKEGGHVAPPASATAGTGRATAVEDLIDALLDACVEAENTPADLRIANISLRDAKRDLLNFIASEHQRGLAEGERIGIEKAAKVADDHPLSPSPVKTVERIVSAIRALNTKPAPEIDPNAWAFKHGLEST